MSNTYISDSEIPVCRVITPLHEQLEKRRREKVEALFLPSIPLPIAARATAAHPAGVLALSVIGLHAKLERGDTFPIRPAVLEQLGIPSHRWSRMARALELAGFIKLNKRNARRPSVTLIDAEYLSWLRS